MDMLSNSPIFIHLSSLLSPTTDYGASTTNQLYNFWLLYIPNCHSYSKLLAICPRRAHCSPQLHRQGIPFFVCMYSLHELGLHAVHLSSRFLQVTYDWIWLWYLRSHGDDSHDPRSHFHQLLIFRFNVFEIWLYVQCSVRARSQFQIYVALYNLVGI